MLSLQFDTWDQQMFGLWALLTVFITYANYVRNNAVFLSFSFRHFSSRVFKLFTPENQ